jgi:exonuclease III
LCNKTCGVLELLKDNAVDICCVTESWLKSKDSAIFAEIHDHGYDIFSAPRRGRGGGVAFLFNPSRLKPIRNNTNKFSSFEALECLIKTSSQLLRLCVIYRSTQISCKERYNETKMEKFTEEFENYLDSLLLKSGTPILCGDFNIHVEDTNDKVAKTFVDLYESKGFLQHVKSSTHIAGGTLDLVLTLGSKADSIAVQNLEIESHTATTSDHYLVHFELPVKLHKATAVLSEVKQFRELKKIDLDTFRQDLASSPLNTTDLSSLTLDDAVQLYQDVLQCLLDKHAPVLSKKFRINKTPWWDMTCQQARTEKRKAKRNIKDEESKETHKEKCIDAAIIINKARNRFYDKKLSSLKGDPQGTYKVINRLLDKQYGSNTLPNGDNDETIATNLMTFFDNKVKTIYSEISNSVKGPPLKPASCVGDPARTDPARTDPARTDPAPGLSEFNCISTSELNNVIMNMPNKSSVLDVVPMWLFKNCLPELIDICHYIVNTSLCTGSFPSSLKSAMIRPGLKKPTLDSDELKNYRPISNLTYLSKIIEKVVHKQLTEYTDTNKLFSDFQSGYRKGHSCETAVTRIHNDILLMVDRKENVVLLLLDLSAAFDTINHKLLLKKLTNLYGINGYVLKWLESYLVNRSFKVIVNNSSSSSCCLEIGVPQGSILGPLLFIMYTKDLENIVTKYGFSIHLYADDTQVYFAFDVHSPSPDMSLVIHCFNEIKQWMATNFLKLNDTKTEFIDIGVYESPISAIKLDDKVNIEPSLKAKNLGFIFDHQFNLNDQINTVSQTCYLSIRDLGRIGSHLSKALKIQLVHSNVLSVIDYCNAVYGALSEANLQKLQKIQNNAVRFIFGIYGKDKWQSITPYLKELHFLPVRFRIKYKIVLLVFKCINNLAPSYLSELVNLRDTKRHSLRKDNDFYWLKVPSAPQFSRTEGAFSHCAPKLWNELPYEIRCLTEIDSFKKELKTHYFNIAFN